jgi:hypothetical protein
MIKQFLVVIAAVFVFTGTAFAKLDPEGKKMLGVNWDFGFTSSGVTYGEGVYAEADSEFGKTYGAGFNAGYGLFSSSIVYCGFELLQNELIVKVKDGSNSWKEYYSQKYLDIPIAYRVLFASMYADFGGYYGIRMGNMRYKYTGYYSESGNVEKKYTKNDYGLLFAIGGIIQVDDNSGIDLGLKTKYGIPYVIEFSDYKSGCWSAALTLGYMTLF